MRKSPPPGVERLEERLARSAWGNPWPVPTGLTLSFAPDGTPVGGHRSELFRALNGQFHTDRPATWQEPILRAFQSWAEQAQVNIAVVPDSGEPFGTTALIQAARRFGDIRVAAYPMSPEVLALAVPFEPTAGTWSGDLILNSAYEFDQDDARDSDLYSVVLHEAGHTLGLPHAEDPSSVMYEHYVGQLTCLHGADVQQVRRLYGPRQPDRLEPPHGNDSLATATPLPAAHGRGRHFAQADLTTPADVDAYHFQAPRGGALSVQVRAAGLSLLVPRLDVYDAGGTLVGSATATEPGAADLTVRVDDPHPGATYYAAVSAAGPHFGVGRYELSLGEHGPGRRPDAAREGLAADLTRYDVRAGDAVISAFLGLYLRKTPGHDFATALDFERLPQASPSHDTYLYGGTLTGGYAADFYKVEVPQGGGADRVFTVSAWGLEAGGVEPLVTVYDAGRRAVDAGVILHENGTYGLQILGARAGATYYVAVRPDPHAPRDSGRYLVGMTFNNVPVDLRTFAEGALAGGAEAAAEFVAEESELVHILLTATAPDPSAGVRLTVLDAGGRAVATRSARAGGAESAVLFLEPGTYTLRVAAEGQGPVAFHVRGNKLSESVGPHAHDATAQPLAAPARAAVSGPQPGSNPGASPTGAGIALVEPTSGPYWNGIVSVKPGPGSPTRTAAPAEEVARRSPPAPPNRAARPTPATAAPDPTEPPPPAQATPAAFLLAEDVYEHLDADILDALFTTPPRPEGAPLLEAPPRGMLIAQGNPAAQEPRQARQESLVPALLAVAVSGHALRCADASRRTSPPARQPASVVTI